MRRHLRRSLWPRGRLSGRSVGDPLTDDWRGSGTLAAASGRCLVHHARANHLGGAQMRRAVLHRPRQQELIQLLDLQRPRQPQVIGAGLFALPVPASAPASTCSCSASHVTTAGGAAVTSSGTKPSHGSVHTCTASPRRSRAERPRPGSTKARFAEVSVKNRISSSRVISGKPRSCASSSSENTRVANRPPQHR